MRIFNTLRLRITPAQVIGVLVLLFVTMLAATVALFAYLSVLARPTTMTVIVGGEARLVDTRAETVSDLLQQLDIQLNEGDTISDEGESLIREGMVLRVERARTVFIAVDEQTRILNTPETHPARILAEAGITVAADDRVLLDGTQIEASALAAWPVPVNQIQIRRAVEVTIDDGDTPIVRRTAAETVGEVLYEAGITLYLADAVEPSLSTTVTDGLEVKVLRSVPVSIVADGVTTETRTRAETVGTLLAESGVALMGLDYSIPSEQMPVQAGITVQVIRVTEDILSESAALPFESVSQPDPALELDQVRLLQEGQPGIEQTVIRVRYENGVEVNREVEGTFIVREPRERLVAYGTGVVLRTVETADGSLQYWRKIRMYATSYHPAALGGDNITATGRVLTKGIVGIDPTVIPYGTQVYVPGYGVGIAADTGGPRSTRRWIDLGYDDENFRPWSQYVDVYLLTPVPSNFPYILPD